MNKGQSLTEMAAQLERDLARARVTDFKDASTDQVGVGTVVDVRNATSGTSTTYTILGAWDGDPDRHIISYKTALGAALLGRKAGDAVRVKTGAAEEEYSVVKIARFADQAG